MADIRSVNNTKQSNIDSATLDKLRQQIGTEFTDKKASGKKSRNEMGKDDFMKLMSAQLKYQDPISPVKNEQMAAQLAQFSSLEQMMNVNSNLEKMAAAAKPQENVLAASLIGKRIVSGSTNINYDKKTEPEIKFDLPRSASSVSVSIINGKGEVIRDISMESLKEGAQSIKWNGKGENGLEVPVGSYSFRVSAIDEKKAPIEVKMSSSGVVTGVQFDGGKPMLIVDGQKLSLQSVDKIEDPGLSANTNANILANNKTANSESEKNVNSSTGKEVNNSIKNTQNNLQVNNEIAKIEEDTDSGNSLWRPENM